MTAGTWPEGVATVRRTRETGVLLCMAEGLPEERGVAMTLLRPAAAEAPRYAGEADGTP